jgi:WD40 repeat protein
VAKLCQREGFAFRHLSPRRAAARSSAAAGCADNLAVRNPDPRCAWSWAESHPDHVMLRVTMPITGHEAHVAISGSAPTLITGSSRGRRKTIRTARPIWPETSRARRHLLRARCAVRRGAERLARAPRRRPAPSGHFGRFRCRKSWFLRAGILPRDTPRASGTPPPPRNSRSCASPRPGVNSAAFSPDGYHIVTASDDKTAPVWDTRFATMSTKDLFDEPSERCLLGLTKLTRDAARRLSQGYARD